MPRECLNQFAVNLEDVTDRFRCRLALDVSTQQPDNHGDSLQRLICGRRTG